MISNRESCKYRWFLHEFSKFEEVDKYQGQYVLFQKQARWRNSSNTLSAGQMFILFDKSVINEEP